MSNTFDTPSSNQYARCVKQWKQKHITIEANYSYRKIMLRCCVCFISVPIPMHKYFRYCAWNVSNFYINQIQHRYLYVYTCDIWYMVCIYTINIFASRLNQKHNEICVALTLTCRVVSNTFENAMHSCTPANAHMNLNEDFFVRSDLQETSKVKRQFWKSIKWFPNFVRMQYI